MGTNYPALLPELDEEWRSDFETLKTCQISPTVLRLPQLGLPYSLDTDASDAKLGCTLLLKHEDGNRYPVGFWSRTLSSAERNYSTTEKECLAIVLAIQTLRPYLERELFTVNTDHHSLRWLMNPDDASERLARWRLRLAELDFDATYVRGIKNCLADALSRLTTTGGTTNLIDEEITCFSVLEFHENKPESEEWDDDIQTRCFALDPTASKTAITHDEIVRARHSDPFCKEIASHLEKGERWPKFAFPSSS